MKCLLLLLYNNQYNMCNNLNHSLVSKLCMYKQDNKLCNQGSKLCMHNNQERNLVNHHNLNQDSKWYTCNNHNHKFQAKWLYFGTLRILQTKKKMKNLLGLKVYRNDWWGFLITIILDEIRVLENIFFL